MAEGSSPPQDSGAVRIKTLEVHKIASVTSPLALPKRLAVAPLRRPVADGDVVVVRAEAEKRIYGDLELASGRMAKIFRGDLIVGALGTRRALKGYVGRRPVELGPGDKLAILNLGGVLGVPELPDHPDLGPPCPVRVEGFVLDEKGRVASVAHTGLPPRNEVPSVPLVVVSGTCMASGKTRTVCEIIHEVTERGKRINAGKLTGIACLRDLYAMSDHGARRTLSFLDCGLVSTAGVERPERAVRTILGHLESDGPDLLVVELGDGILGEYGVLEVLRELREYLTFHVVCATDPVGAWGAHKLLCGESIPVDLFSGPCTDSVVGIRFIEENLGLPGVNACRDPGTLGTLVLKGVEEKR